MCLQVVEEAASSQKASKRIAERRIEMGLRDASDCRPAQHAAGPIDQNEMTKGEE